jgi:transcriptional regulator with XRE-family HTH domain
MDENVSVGQRLKIFIKSLDITIAEFCRRSDLGRPVVDKIISGKHWPGGETLYKVICAYPVLRLNWLITGEGSMIGSVANDEETVILELFRKNIKSKKDEYLTMDFLSVIEWSAQEYQELKELDLSIKAHSINLDGYQKFSSLVILQQRQRRAISELRRSKRKGGFNETEDQQNKLKNEVSRITNEIQKTINILDGE